MKSSRPKVDVSTTAVIPAYNAAAWVSRAIQSVLDQSVPVDEIIVVDDGSTDTTHEVVQQQFPSVRYIFRTNRGPSAARNAGAAAAKSRWIAFLDADDQWLPEKTARQQEVMRSNPNAVLIYSDLWDCDLQSVVRYHKAASPQQLWPRMRAMNCIPATSPVVRRDAWERIGGYNESLRTCEDWEFYVRLRMLGEFAHVPEPLAMYTVLPVSGSSNPRRMLETFEQILEPTLLNGLTGIKRWAWRRRARASQLLAAGLISRSAGNRSDELSFLRRSLIQWPSPFWQPRRFKTLAASLLHSKKE